MRNHSRICGILTAGLLLCSPGQVLGQSAENVAVVINDASPTSEKIGEYYVQKRNVPKSNVIRIRTELTETVDRAKYLSTIEQPIASAIARESLHDRILYIVLTKGVPLRIDGTSGVNGTTASVDSELALLYRRMVGRIPPVNGPIENPYYLGSKPATDAQLFTHRKFDIYLVTRLDGFAVEEVLALIDRALTPSTSGRVILRQRGVGQGVGNAWLAEAAANLNTSGNGARAVLNLALTPSATAEVIGYYSWGSNDFVTRTRRFGVNFVPGALAATFVSTDARTFNPPPDNWQPSADWNSPDKLFAGSPQTLTGDLIREGVTGVAGHVAEPQFQSAIRPQILFPAYFSGLNLAEAFYSAMPHLSWQTVVIGDPLCAPFRTKSLTRAEIEDAVDANTELPAIFGRRRVDAVVGGLKADRRAVELGVTAQSRLARSDTFGAQRALEEATQLAPNLAGMQLQLALLYEQNGEHARARARYKTILALDSSNITALNNLAYSLAVHEHAMGEAAVLARRAVSLAPSNPVILDTLAWIEHLQGNNEAAAKLLTQALEKGPVLADVRFHAAVVYAEVGAWAAAELQLEKALAADESLSTRDDVVRLRQKLANRRK